MQVTVSSVCACVCVARAERCDEVIVVLLLMLYLITQYELRAVQVIRLRFTHLSLWGQTDTCSDMADQVTVQEPGRKRVCMSATTTTLVTKSNQATVRFVSNELGHALGFRAFYRAGQCLPRICVSLSTVS